MEARTCLVTGAGRGIGRAVAQRLSEQGHRVALTARSVDQLDEVAAALPGPALVTAADLTSAAEVERVFRRLRHAVPGMVERGQVGSWS